ncbi:hypothetical protein ACFLSV_07755 [Bacteroidota bacterium]
MGKRENPDNLVGKKFNKLTVIKHLGLRPVGSYINKQTGKKKLLNKRFYLYRCECGREKVTTIGNIRRQIGCRHCGAKRDNPKYKNPTYKFWLYIVNYNYRKSGGVYKLKNKRSIWICDRWLSSFDVFVKDIGEPPTSKHVIGRIDESKGFTPDNCKWMTREERGSINSHFNELTMINLSKKVGITNERVRQITNIALKNKEDELNNLIERIDYINTNKRVVYKPEAIEYFKNKKYFKNVRKSEVIVKQYYLKGIDAKTAAKELNKPTSSILRYYKKFTSEEPSKSSS